MRDKIDSIIQLWAEYYGIRFSSDAGEALARMMEEKYKPTNKSKSKCQCSCCWTFDDIDCRWETECGEAHVFEVEGPVENKYNFCPYCGKQIN